MKSTFFAIDRIKPGVWEVRCGDCMQVLDTNLDGLNVLLEQLDTIDSRHECQVTFSRG